VREDFERRTEKQGNECERVNVKDARLEEERRGGSNDKIERAEKIPRHRPIESIRSVSRHHQCYDRREDSS